MAELSVASVLALLDKTLSNIEDMSPKASEWRNEEVEQMLVEIRFELARAEIAMAERGPRHLVGDPIILPSSRYVHGILVRPCSARHRHLFLQGYFVLSCKKCSIVRLEDGEIPS